MRSRIYAALAYLVSEEYLREGRKTAIPMHSSLSSDAFVPTQKGFEEVDRRQAALWKKLWSEFADKRGGIAALVAAIVSATVTLLTRWLF